MSEFDPSGRAITWDAESLWRRLSPLLPDLSIEVLARVESTNSLVLQRLRGVGAGVDPGPRDLRLPGRRAGDLQPCLLVAEHQTAGRGRMGRGWQAAPGASLTFTLALPLSPPEWSGLSLAIGVALAEALEPPSADPQAAARIRIKWPNDLWLDERKLGGVLVETLVVGDQRMAVIGVGVNVLPVDFGPLNTGFACVAEFDASAHVATVLHQVAPALVSAMRLFEREGFGVFQARYAARDALRGRTVRAGMFEGVSLGVDASGALRLETAEGEQLVTSNEVSVRTDPWDATTTSGPPTC